MNYVEIHTAYYIEKLSKTFDAYCNERTFDPTLPMIELDPDFVKTNILSKFEEYWVKPVAARD